MKAIIIGGTGATGREVVLQLLADPRVENVTVLVRKPFFSEDAKLSEIVVDFKQLENYADLIEGDVAISTLGTTRKIAGSKQAQWHVDYDYQLKFAALAKQRNINTFILLSAYKANSHSNLFYSRMKGQLEDDIKQVGFARLIILKPSLIERPNSVRGNEKMAFSVLNFFNKIGLFKSYSPISTINLAKVIIDVYFHQIGKPIEVYENNYILNHIPD